MPQQARRVSLQDFQKEFRQEQIKINKNFDKNAYTFRRGDSKMMQDVRRELRRSLSLQSEQIKRLSQSKADKQLRLQQEKEARESENAPDQGVDDVGKEKNQRLRRGKSVSFAPGSPELKRFQSSACLVEGQEGSAVQRKQAKTAKWAKMRSLSWRSGLGTSRRACAETRCDACSSGGRAALVEQVERDHVPSPSGTNASTYLASTSSATPSDSGDQHSIAWSRSASHESDLGEDCPVGTKIDPSAVRKLSGPAAAIPDDADYPALADRFGSLPEGAATASSTIKTNKKKKYKTSNTAIEEVKTTPNKKLGGQKASSSMCALM